MRLFIQCSIFSFAAALAMAPAAHACQTVQDATMALIQIQMDPQTAPFFERVEAKLEALDDGGISDAELEKGDMENFLTILKKSGKTVDRDVEAYVMGLDVLAKASVLKPAEACKRVETLRKMAGARVVKVDMNLCTEDSIAERELAVLFSEKNMEWGQQNLSDSPPEDVARASSQMHDLMVDLGREKANENWPGACKALDALEKLVGLK